jgi:hypothetical protein
MRFLAQPFRVPRRGALPTIGHRRLSAFAALLCLCALAGTARAQEPPKGLSEGPAASAETGSASVQEAKTPGDAANPLTPHQPGIYYVGQKGDTHQLVQLEQASAGGRSSSGGRGKRNSTSTLKWKSVIYGSNARVRFAAGRPLFYFYFPPPDASASGYSETAFRPSSTPNAFLLVHLEGKKNEREIPAKGVAMTVEPKDLVPFDYEKVAAGVYKVQLKNDLGAGEYAFLFGEALQSMAGVSLFDFGIDGAK